MPKSKSLIDAEGEVRELTAAAVTVKLVVACEAEFKRLF